MRTILVYLNHLPNGYVRYKVPVALVEHEEIKHTAQMKVHRCSTRAWVRLQ